MYEGARASGNPSVAGCNLNYNLVHVKLEYIYICKVLHVHCHNTGLADNNLN